MNHSRGSDQQHWVRSLVQQYQTPLIRYARSIVRDEHFARDVVQEAFLKLCQQSPDDLAGHEAAWLFRVCHNLAINRQRKDRRMTTNNEMVHAVATGSDSEHQDPARRLSASEDHGRLSDLIDGLSENQQQVIRLKFHSGLKYREISEATGLSVSNVGFLLHTGLQKLREKMQVLDLPAP